ncbi:WD40 repeat domain-containing serine/threonine protein kinase [Gemmata sp.]|uniref:WD40 repeat domain-containing serine/threonine protein kinase n=1 Tax=Gemmata sp. TaxID=1914242 RepID=UPI003F70C79B
MPADPIRARDVFLAAVELPSEKWPGYVADACRGDAGLRAEVDRLLAAHADPDSILEPPSLARTDVTGGAAPPARRPAYEETADLGSDAATGTFGGPPAPAGPAHATALELGTTVAGRYTLVAVIGEGGMGSVYLASQSEPVKRQVALKLIKAGMDTKAVLARFDAERQALALMDHPNIARVYDGGTTEQGQPFFVMELVRGVPVTEYCDQKRLPVAARLELFVAVCQAVQHAHQKGIIHRDLKPGNVLVTEVDGRPTPKVIDFGVAKATELKLTDLSFSDAGAIVGTPAYMSPEQADPTSMDIDTRTDVYALGVVLYELLTGSPPIDSKQFKRGAILEMLRMVREVEPPRPSTRLSTAVALPSIAAVRGIEPLKLARLLRGELDWVVMKALEKDRGRRYETANGLARDIQRYLDDEVVEARPPSTAYRLQKFVRRHKGRVLAAGLVLLSLVAGVVASTYFAVRAGEEAQAARRAEGEAKRAEGHAESEARTARQAEGEANDHRGRAETARAEAEGNRNLLRAERDQGRQKLYYAEMTLAGLAAEAPAGLGRVGELLARWGPAAPGTDLRGWEWYHLDSLARQATLTLRGHAGSVHAVAYAPDGKRLATGGADNAVRIWDAATGREVACVRGHTGPVNGVAWSPDGGRLATASKDGTARIWDAASGREVRQLCGPGVAVTAVAWRPDGARVAATGHDMRAHVWDADTGREVISSPVGGSWGTAVAWNPDGKLLAVGSWGSVAKVLDAGTGALVADLPGRPPHGILGVAWSPTGDRLATAAWEKTVRIWDTKTWKERAVLTGAEYYLHGVCWSPDGKQIAAGGGNRAVQVWDADSGRVRSALRGNGGDVLAVAWNPNGGSVAATGEEGVTRVWAVPPGPGPGKVQPGWTQIKLSPDGTKSAESGKDNLVRVSNAATAELIRTLEGAPGTPLRICWSPDGTRIACSGWGWALAVWDPATGKRVVLTEVTTTGRHWGLAWSPSGDRVATGNDGGRICLWDPTTGRKLLEMSCNTGVGGLSWSPGGRQIASSRWDGLATIWDTSTGAEVRTLRGHSGQVLSVGWSPDGTRIATGSYDRTVRVWDAATGQETLTLRGHTAAAREVHWHPTGCQLVTRDDHGNVLTWDAMPSYLGERSPATLRDLGDRIGRDATDATARRLRAEVLARRGDWDAAAVDFTELARHPAPAAVAYPGGWWAVDGPGDRPPAFPPSDATARWLAPADDPNGFVSLPQGGKTAVCRVFAPRRAVAALDIGPVPPDRLWLNETAVPLVGTAPTLVELREGWNSLAVRGGPGESFVRWRDFDRPADPLERQVFTRAAALAATGPGSAERFDEATRARFRRLALGWLRADLADWGKLLDAGPPYARRGVVQGLGHWQRDAALAGVRDATALAELPGDEQKAFAQFWADVATLRKQAAEKTSPAVAPPPRETRPHRDSRSTTNRSPPRA